MTTADFILLLGSRGLSPRRTGAGFEARCPAHDDHNASLSITEGNDGRILLHCHAGCSVESIVAAIELKLADLFPQHVKRQAATKSRIVATYDYTDEGGTLLFQCIRFEPKDFKQRRPDPAKPGGWIWDLKGTRRVLYRLAELKAAIAAGSIIYIVEGEKDVDALVKHGFAATCNPMGAGKWLPEHTETLRGVARVIVIADKDAPGRRHAHIVATALHGVAKSVKLIELPDRDAKAVKDAADFFGVGGSADELRAHVDAAPEFATASEAQPCKAGSVANEYLGGDSDDETIARLAALPLIEYERQRDKGAERLGIKRVSILDKLVEAKRPKKADSTLQGSTVVLPDIEPWPDPVDGAELLDEIRSTLHRYVVASDPALSASALYALHTYAFDLGDISPILFISGPTKRCGKSRLLSGLALLVNRPLAASSASPAGIYRTIELHQPTLLIDEVDAFMRGDDQLRGLVNSGHTRDAAFHLGCVAKGDDYQPCRWSTWAPKIFSGIGRLADTVEDRAIIIPMRRRRKDEVVERLRHGTRFEDLRRKCARFIADHAETIRAANPTVPHTLNDRAADNWTPLLTLADLAGGYWPDMARRAALQLSGSRETEALDIKEQLLADIRSVFGEAQTDRMASKDLCERLPGIEGRPWAEFGRNRKPISPNQLAYQLRELGIASRNIRIGGATPKGYHFDDFADAFLRYLPENGVLKRYTATKPVNIDQNPLYAKATVEPCGVSENASSVNDDAGCGVVADRKPGEATKEAKLVEEFA